MGLLNCRLSFRYLNFPPQTRGGISQDFAMKKHKMRSRQWLSENVSKIVAARNKFDAQTTIKNTSTNWLNKKSKEKIEMIRLFSLIVWKKISSSSSCFFFFFLIYIYIYKKRTKEGELGQENKLVIFFLHLNINSVFTHFLLSLPIELPSFSALFSVLFGFHHKPLSVSASAKGNSFLFWGLFCSV